MTKNTTEQTGAKRPSNPLAFPLYDAGLNYAYEGIRLRDSFAAKAMAALEITQAMAVHDGAGAVPSEWMSEVAAGAYRQADAMLKAREVGGEA